MLVLLIVSALVVAVANGEAGTESELMTAATAPEAAPVRELPDRRTATSRTFQLSNGQLESRIFEIPVNYRDANGEWKPIDEELTELPSGAITNGANSFDVHLPEDLDEAPIRVTVGEEWVSEAPLGVQTSIADLGQDGTATYSTADGAVDLEFEGLANGLKESISLAGAVAPSTYRFQVDASDGVVPALTQAGSIAFRDQGGDLVAEMPPPFMVDAAGVQAPADAVYYTLREDGEGAWEVAVVASEEWLGAEGRSFPVLIDPTVTISAPALDCLIANTTESQMCGTTGNTYLTAKAKYLSSGQTDLARTLLRFDTSTIQKSASLTSATIGLYSSKAATNITKVDMYDVSQAWTNAATWQYARSSNPKQKWTAPGGDYGKYMSTPTSLTTPEALGAESWLWKFSGPELNWLTQRWINGEIPNNGVLLKLADEVPHVCCIERRAEWLSSTAPAGKKPYLSVQFIEPAMADRIVTSPTDGTKTAKRFLLTSAWKQSGVEGVTFQSKTTKGWKDIPGSQVIDGNNQSITWPYPVTKPEDRESRPLYWDASGLTGSNPTAKVQIRAVMKEYSGFSGFTKPVSAEVDKNNGGPKDATAPIGPGSVDLLTGNFTVSPTDVSISAFNSTLEFSRSFNSREAEVEPTGVLGPGWKPASPLEEAGGSSWSKLVLKQETEELEGESIPYKWAELTHSEGSVLAFEENASNQFDTPPEMSGYVLYRNTSTGNIEFTDPDGNRTIFSNFGSGSSEYLPISVAMTGGPGNKSRMIYELVGGKRRLWKVIAPAAPGISCPDEGSSAVDGCRLLVFSYQSATTWGAPESAGSRLSKITYYASGHGGPWDVAQYSYNTKGQLSAVWDPRISPNLKETYTYLTKGQIGSLDPPGQQPWFMSYKAEEGVVRGRLGAVTRSSLVESDPTAQTTISYDVPVSGSGAPYDMGGEAVAAWGQKDMPTDATAIFPPDEVPSSPPSSYTRATVYYMDAEGQVSNVATESGAGTSAPSITTTETDKFGNVVRELSAQNRLRALAAESCAIGQVCKLDTQFRYSDDGTELQEEKGPIHQVRLETGEEAGSTVQARSHRSIQYNNPAPGAGEAAYHLPTTETSGALLSNGSVVDKRGTKYVYNWTLRKPIETISDPEGTEETKSVTVYDSNGTGLPIEVRQPKNAAGGGAGTTRFVYFKDAHNSPNIANCESDLYAGLPCKVEPAAQPGTVGLPQLPVKKFLDYNQLGQVEEATESPGGGGENVRKSITIYDAAGRQKTSEIIGGGVPVPKVETLYSTIHGKPIYQRFVCPISEPGCDTQESSMSYDTLGRVEKYVDADGATTNTTYDLLGRTEVIGEAKGVQTFNYDSVTGLLTELVDSTAGTFTATYDADGQLVKRGLPNGLTAETTYDEAGAPSGLTYTKASSCGLSCNWLNFDVERSIHGQILREDGTLGKDEYAYDKLGRLTTAKETPSGGICTTRSYKYDKDSNREEMTTTPGTLGVCSGSGGTTQKYCYDSADRLLGEAPSCTGVSYDPFGRITNLPAGLAGGKALATTYFSNDMVATQSQNGVTNTFQLDAMLRQRQRLQAGGLEGTEVFHYAGPGDSPTWTQRGSAWTRSIVGIGGELAAIRENGKEAQLQLTNLHGDVAATAALNPAVTELKGTFRFDEFGNPTGGSAGRFGWLGGKQRRTELSSGVIQMGARSYVSGLGRFLSTDPILGGSASAYDYANADPINQFDLDGTIPTLGKCRFHVDDPHPSTHRKRKSINVVLQASCMGSKPALAKARVRMSIYNGAGQLVARGQWRTIMVPIQPGPVSPKPSTIGFGAGAPKCVPGYYRGVADIVLYPPPPYGVKPKEGRSIGRVSHIAEC